MAKVFVACLDVTQSGVKQWIIQRLKSLRQNPMPTQHWRWESMDGKVIAEQHGGPVIIHQQTCLALLGTAIEAT